MSVDRSEARRPRRGRLYIVVGAILAVLAFGAAATIASAVVDHIPVTTWYRPMTDGLRSDGLPAAGDGKAWYRDATGGRYRPLSDTARRRLLGRPKRRAAVA